MTPSFNYSLNNHTLTIELLSVIPQNLGKLICDLVETNSSSSVQTILIDFTQVNHLNAPMLVHLSYMRMLPFLEEIDIQLINVKKKVFETFSKVGLNHFFPIRVTADDEDSLEDTESAPEVSCPSCGFELEETLTPLIRQSEELKIVRNQMVNLEKLNSIGQLSAGVAHEFNNIIAGMKGFAQLALESMHPQDIKQALEVVVKLSDRAEKITEGLLSFARKKNPHKTISDLNEVIEAQLDLFKNELHIHGIELKNKLTEIPKTLVDIHQIEQVLLNLITNAIHAMDKGGKLIIGSFAEDDQIVLQIEDTGKGIPKDIAEKIFDPFFTTKGALGGGSNEGTGLGLSVSQGIIFNHNGKIEVDSEPNVGTAFTIRLPIIERATPLVEKSVKKETPASLAGKEGLPLKILIVDDEQPILQALSMYLVAKGHTVFTSVNAKEGISQFINEKPDLVFLDIIMPDMNGADVFIEMKKINRNFHTAVITGHAGKHLEVLLRTMSQIGKITVFRKPFNMKDINQFVSKISPEEER